VSPPPTFEHALSIFAYHIQEIAREPKRLRVHFYGGVTGDYTFVTVDEPPVPLWDQAHVPGKGSIGNRCAARNDYTERCAPILAAIAAGTYSEG
jgi:hypothetical protein